MMGEDGGQPEFEQWRRKSNPKIIVRVLVYEPQCESSTSSASEIFIYIFFESLQGFV